MTHPATTTADPDAAEAAENGKPANGQQPNSSDPSTSHGPVRLPTPPLPGTTATPPAASPASTAATPPTPSAGATPTGANPTAAATAPGRPGTTTGPNDPNANDGKSKTGETNSQGRREHDSDSDTKANADTPPSPAMPPEAANALNGLANLGPQLANPLIGAATGIPAAALSGLGGLIPGLASAVMPQLAALANQLGTGAPPSALPGGIRTSGADKLAGPLGALAGEGSAADQARTKQQALARQVGALHEVEQKLSQILGVSSARTEADRAKLRGVIDDVETALQSAGVQGDTPEAQAAVLKAMRKALDEAGSVVSSAAHDKLTDAQFVRALIHDYLAAAASTDELQAGVAGSGAGADAARIAHKALGLPYVWGGGGALGPTGGGFDCSGLTQWAIAKATGGRVVLPRTTYDQIKMGRAVGLNALTPGDLIFSNFSAPGVPEHVQLYIGNGQVIEAADFGIPIRISNLPHNAQARRVL